MATKTTSTTKTTETSAVLAAQEHVAALETTVAELKTELEQMRQEAATLRETYSSGKPMDIDRMMDLEESLIPRREERLHLLTSEALPSAIRAARQEELWSLAREDVDGIAGSWEAYQARIATAEQAVAEALGDVRAAAGEWSAFIGGVGRAAKAAGLSHNGPGADHPIRYVSSWGAKASDPITVLFEDESYAPVTPDAAVRGTVARADTHAAGLIRQAQDARVVSEGQRVQALDRR